MIKITLKLEVGSWSPDILHFVFSNKQRDKVEAILQEFRELEASENTKENNDQVKV